MTTAAAEHSFTDVWLSRLRCATALAIIWAGFHYVVEGFIVPSGTHRPLVLVNAVGGPLGGLLVVAMMWGGAALATLLIGARDARKPLLILGLGLALWTWGGGRQGGTMDTWLIFSHPTRSGPTAEPYVSLLSDYLYLLIGLAGAISFATILSARRTGDAQPPGWLGFKALTERPGPGLTALAVTLVIAGIVVYFAAAAGATAGQTFRGQVHFAVLAGLALGTYAASQVVKQPPAIWLWTAPILLGVVGLVGAAINPALALPAEYKDLDSIPAWGLARALPIEMVGVGLVAIAWILPHGRHAEEKDDGH
jgi:hypothetical protein